TVKPLTVLGLGSETFMPANVPQSPERISCAKLTDIPEILIYSNMFGVAVATRLNHTSSSGVPAPLSGIVDWVAPFTVPAVTAPQFKSALAVNEMALAHSSLVIAGGVPMQRLKVVSASAVPKLNTRT